MSASSNDINSLFLSALHHLLGRMPRGSKRRLAGQIGVSPGHFSDILKGRRGTSEDQRRRLADFLDYPGPMYEDFLALGQDLLEKEAGGQDQSPPVRLQPVRSRPVLTQPGTAPEAALLAPDGSPLACLGQDEMRERGFLAVPFSEEMKLAAGGGGTIPITEDEDTSPVIVHGPSLGLRTAKHLQAFRVGGDSMEPLIAQNGIVLADVSRNDIQRLQEGGIYVLCWDRDEGECAVKRLRWAERGRLLLIESEDRFYPPKVMPVEDIILIGQVIWAWREFKYR